jgi:hypothetical protein
LKKYLDDFLGLTLADIQACFTFAANLDRRLTVVPYEVTANDLSPLFINHLL